MNRETLDRYCERGILGLVLAILVFGPLSTGAVRPQELLVLVALSAGVLVLWAFRLWLGERPKLLLPPICWTVLAFIGYAIVRYLICDIEYVGRLELLRMLVYAVLFFAILSNLHRQESTQIIAFTLIFLAMSIAMCAVWQYLARLHRVPSLGGLIESMVFTHKRWYFDRVYMDRASGTYINPNHLAGFLEMLLPVTLAYIITGRGKPLTKVLLSYAALVMLAGIVATGSRGSWAATAVGLFVLFGLLAFHRSYRLPALAMLLLIGGAGAYLGSRSEFFKQRVETTFADGHVELDVRYELWNSTVQMWEDNPWYGVGPGHFDYRFRKYRPQSVQLRPDRAHNEYLNLLADWGIVGAALIGLVLIALFAGVIKTWRHVRRSEREFNSNRSNKFAYVIGAAVGLIALLCHSVVDFNLQIPANAILAVALGALLVSHVRFATDNYWFGPGILLKVFLSGLFIFGAGYFLYQTQRLGREYVWLERGRTKKDFSDEKIVVLEKAFAAEPKNSETAFAIGECYRTKSFEGGHEFEDQEGYEQLGERALTWFRRGTNCNAYDDRIYVAIGRTQDWLARPEEARTSFYRADELDPNGYWTSAFIGRHYVQTEDYAAAKVWLERSLKLQGKDNKIAETYLEVVNNRLLDAAAPPASQSGQNPTKN